MCGSLATKNYCQLPVDWESNKFILKNVEVLVILTAIKAYYNLLHLMRKVKFLYLLKCTHMPSLTQLFYPHAQLHSIFLFSSIIITTHFKLHLLRVSEIGKFHTLVLNFAGWSVTRFFGRKSVIQMRGYIVNQSTKE